MFKYLVGISLAGLVLFGGIHVWMRLEGSPGSEIQAVLIGWLIFGAFCSFFSTMRHGTGFGIWCVIMVPLSVWCGMSILAIGHPILGIAVGLFVLVALLWLAYQEYLDTPYGHYHRPIKVVPGLGAVIMSGKTPRAVAQEVRVMKNKRES